MKSISLVQFASDNHKHFLLYIAGLLPAGQKGLAEDLLQEVYLRLVKYGDKISDKFDDDKARFVYIQTISKREVWKHFYKESKRYAKEKSNIVDDDGTDILDCVSAQVYSSDTFSDPVDVLVHSEISEVIDGFICEHTEQVDKRDLLRAVFVDGLGTKEVCSDTGVPPSTGRTWVARFRKYVKEVL